jgi:hypothetical protein
LSFDGGFAGLGRMFTFSDAFSAVANAASPRCYPASNPILATERNDPAVLLRATARLAAGRQFREQRVCTRNSCRSELVDCAAGSGYLAVVRPAALNHCRTA